MSDKKELVQEETATENPDIEKLRNKNNELIQENRKLKELLAKKDEEIASMKQALEQGNPELDRLRKENEELRNTINRMKEEQERVSLENEVRKVVERYGGIWELLKPHLLANARRTEWGIVVDNSGETIEDRIKKMMSDKIYSHAFVASEAKVPEGVEPKNDTNTASTPPSGNPFTKKEWNQTKQIEIARQNPEQAYKMAVAAGNVPPWLEKLVKST